jgi:hypothetical protein
MKKVSEVLTKEAKVCMDNKTFGNGGSIKTADITSFGFLTRIDAQTSTVPKSELIDGKFVPMKDENDKVIMQNITFPIAIGTVNGVVGGTIPAGPLLRGLNVVGALNEAQVQLLIDTYGEKEVKLEFSEENNRKKLIPITEEN